MVNGVARLVKMCRNRSGLDELMVILDGTTVPIRRNLTGNANANGCRTESERNQNGYENANGTGIERIQNGYRTDQT